jgi:hypothetical protein
VLPANDSASGYDCAAARRGRTGRRAMVASMMRSSIQITEIQERRTIKRDREMKKEMDVDVSKVVAKYPSDAGPLVAKGLDHPLFVSARKSTLAAPLDPGSAYPLDATLDAFHSEAEVVVAAMCNKGSRGRISSDESASPRLTAQHRLFDCHLYLYATAHMFTLSHFLACSLHQS